MVAGSTWLPSKLRALSLRLTVLGCCHPLCSHLLTPTPRHLRPHPSQWFPLLFCYSPAHLLRASYHTNSDLSSQYPTHIMRRAHPPRGSTSRSNKRVFKSESSWVNCPDSNPGLAHTNSIKRANYLIWTIYLTSLCLILPNCQRRPIKAPIIWDCCQG